MGAGQQRGAKFWQRSAAEVDASFFDERDHPAPPRRRPAANVITPREEAESNARWARAQLREKLRGPVTLAEGLSLGLGAAALAALVANDGARHAATGGLALQGSARDPGDIAARGAAAPPEVLVAAAPDPAGTFAEAGDWGRKAARGTTIIPTTILRPLGEGDGLALTKAPATIPLPGRGLEAAQPGLATPLLDAGAAIAAIQSIAVGVAGEAEIPPVAPPSPTLGPAAGQPVPASTGVPDRPGTAPDAPPGSATPREPGHAAPQATAGPDALSAEAKPTAASSGDAAGMTGFISQTAKPPNDPARREPSREPGEDAIHDTRISDGPADDQGEASNLATVGQAYIANQDVAAVARLSASDDVAIQAAAEQGPGYSGRATYAVAVTAEAKPDQGRDVPPTGPVEALDGDGSRTGSGTEPDRPFVAKIRADQLELQAKAANLAAEASAIEVKPDQGPAAAAVKVQSGTTDGAALAVKAGPGQFGIPAPEVFGLPGQPGQDAAAAMGQTGVSTNAALTAQVTGILGRLEALAFEPKPPGQGAAAPTVEAGLDLTGLVPGQAKAPNRVAEVTSIFGQPEAVSIEAKADQDQAPAAITSQPATPGGAALAVMAGPGQPGIPANQVIAEPSNPFTSQTGAIAAAAAASIPGIGTPVPASPPDSVTAGPATGTARGNLAADDAEPLGIADIAKALSQAVAYPQPAPAGPEALVMPGSDYAATADAISIALRTASPPVERLEPTQPMPDGPALEVLLGGVRSVAEADLLIL